MIARSLSVVTFMPAATLRQHDAASVRSPSTSTMQARQLPTGVRPSLWHRCGMVDAFALRRLDQMVSPARAATGWPSSVNSTRGASASSSSEARARSCWTVPAGST